MTSPVTDRLVVAVCWLDREKSGDLPLPSYETDGSAGMDVCAALDGEHLLHPGERTLIPTGLAVAVPNGYEIQVRPRSGLAVRHGVTVVNAPGTIDSDYRGEVKIALINLGHEPYLIRRGDRIAQLVVAPVVTASLRLEQHLEPTRRGDGGFGHTGVR